jgi:RNA polymerase sigma factor (sigma-70 family)
MKSVMRIRVTWAGALGARQPHPAGSSRAPRAPGGTARTADEALTRLYTENYLLLVRLAALLVADVTIAEDITQAAFVAMSEATTRLSDTGAAVAYLRRSLVNRSRAVQRRRSATNHTRGAHRPRAIGVAVAAAGDGHGHRFEREPVVVMLGSLPERQREALVLRYYGGLSESDAAAAMGVSKAALRQHAARGMAALRASWLTS